MSVSSVQGNPMGAADLSQIRRSRTGQTLRRRPEASPFTGGRGGRKRARGIAATPVAATERDGALRRGTPRGLGTDVGRCPRQVAGASSGPASRCVPPPVPQSWGSGNPVAMDREAARTRQRGRTAAPRPQRPRISAGTPWTAAAPEAAKRAGRKPSRRRETSRTDTSRGRQPRDHADPPAHVVEGAREPQEGKVPAVRLVPEPRRRALRGAQA